MSEKKEARTIQVKIGQQTAREMTPDQAAEYLKCMAAASSSNPLRTDRVAFTFGSRSSKKDGDGKSGFWKISAEAKEIAAHSINAAVTKASSGSRSGSSGSGGSGSGSNSSIPCTEKEMKALMSMFVEIMGLQMNTEKLNSVSRKNRRRDLFRFPEDIPPPPGGWPTDLMWPSKDLEDYASEEDDEVQEDDSLPDLEDIPVEDRERKRETTGGDTKKSVQSEPERLTTYSQNNGRLCYVAGIAVPEWEALERVAMEDALEQEERARKAATTTSTTTKKSKRTSQRSAVQSVTDTVDARRNEQKKQQQHEKALAQWRQKVVSACQSNDTEVLRDLLKKAPAAPGKSDGNDEPIDSLYQQCLMDLAVNCLPKNRQSIEKGRESRSMLLQHILKSAATQVVMTPLRNGRSVLHTACFYGDEGFVQMILKNASAFDNLARTCEESGWTPLHYAAVSGSSKTVQHLVKKGGADLKQKITNDTHTWDPSTGRGLSVTQLLVCLMKQGADNKSLMETHGMAVAEVEKDLMSTKGSSARYLQWLDQVLFHMDGNSFGNLSSEKLKDIDALLIEEEPTHFDLDDTAINTEKSDSTVPNNKKKTKKKKKAKQNETTPEKDDSPAAPPVPAPMSQVTRAILQDPLVELLKGMGFEEGPIVDGIKACGGTDRATADLVIAWMLERNQSEPSEQEAPPEHENTDLKPAPITDLSAVQKSSQPANTANKAETQPEIMKNDDGRILAERLAAKREERRQRNREWNKKQEAQHGTTTSTTTTFPKQQQLPPPPQQQPVQVSPSAPSGSASLSGRTVEFAVEPSNSGGDYAKDDDLTVSTIGSRTTTTQPAQTMPAPVAAAPISAYNPSSSLAQNMPPGFGSLTEANSETAISSTNESRGISQPWQTPTPLASYQGQSLPSGSFMPPGLNQHLYSGLPPGIPETHPVLDERVRAPYGGAPLGAGIGVGPPTSALASSLCGLGEDTGVILGGGASPSLSTGYSTGLEHTQAAGLGVLSSAVAANNPSVLAGYTQSAISSHDSFGVQGILHQNNTTAFNGFSANTSAYHGSESLFPQARSDGGYMGTVAAPPLRPAVASISGPGFGFPSPGVDSSMIESISTGTGDLGGSSLWAPSNPLSGDGSEVASSLLRHLISDTEEENTRSGPALFSQTYPNDERRRNAHSIW